MNNECDLTLWNKKKELSEQHSVLKQWKYHKYGTV